MSVGISVKGVKPFDGTNFQGWKAQVNALFVMNDVLDVVEGTREAPAAGAGQAATLKKKVKDDATAKFIILSNLDEAQQVCVLSCISAKEMWEKLCFIHEHQTVKNKLGLLHRYHAYRMSEADTAVQARGQGDEHGGSTEGRRRGRIRRHGYGKNPGESDHKVQHAGGRAG